MTAKRRDQWVRLDVDFWSHPKVLAVGADGQRLFLALVCASYKYDLDGRISGPLGLATAASLGILDPLTVLDTLALHGLLDVSAPEFEYVVHDYETWQESSERRRAKREAADARRARYKETRRERVQNASTETEAETEAEAEK